MDEQKKKFVIEIFRKKDPDELTSALADPEGKLDIGSAAALCAAEACAMALRGARIAAKLHSGEERMEYLLRNIEKLRAYMVYLIDEDVKGRNIMRRAVKEGDPQKIDAAREPAAAISDEVICQMINLADLIEELTAFAPQESAIYLGSAVEYALSSIRSARLFAVHMAQGSSDDTYSFIVRRENEIRLEALRPTAEKILAWAEGNL